VTDSNIDYEGSMTISEDLMEAAGIDHFEKILVSNMANGERFETYAIPGERGKGTITLNGATAHLGKRGDRITIMVFSMVEMSHVKEHRPRIVLLNEKNEIIDRRGC